MPVKKDPSGQRSVEAEVEVPGTPEEVWRAIATGPGISSWFVPSRVEGRVGGAVTCDFGPGMQSVATIQVWDPPRRFAAETVEEPGTVATEWIVEARSGGTCVVRVVHRWFASGDDWDQQFEGHAAGWRDFFRLLRLYLGNFQGQPCSAFQLMGMAAEPKSKAWAALMDALGFRGASVGKRLDAATNVPPIGGLVERVGEEAHPEELLLRLDRPAPGIAHLFAMPMAGQVILSIRLFLYGDQAAVAVARDEPLWCAWIGQRFPATDPSSVTG
jgi:uncharacterized protein YndB with AHSA1/START domain